MRLLKRWEQVKDEEFIWLKPTVYTNSKDRTLTSKPGAKVPRDRFSPFALRGMYKQRRIMAESEREEEVIAAA